jgi:hypothetical protein
MNRVTVVPLAADCRWIVVGVLRVVWSSFVVDPESRLWELVAIRHQADEQVDGSAIMALSRIFPSRVNLAAGCNRPPLVQLLGPSPA